MEHKPIKLPPLPHLSRQLHMLGDRMRRHGIEKLITEAQHKLTEAKTIYVKQIRDNIKLRERGRAKQEAADLLTFVSRSLFLLTNYVLAYEPLAFDFRRRRWVPLTRNHLARRHILKTRAREGHEMAKLIRQTQKRELTALDSKPKRVKNTRGR